MGLGRKDGNTGVFTRMDSRFRGNDGMGRSRRQTEDGMVGRGFRRVRGECLNPLQSLKRRRNEVTTDTTGCRRKGTRETVVHRKVDYGILRFC